MINKDSLVLIIQILICLKTTGHSQLIGKEKNDVFLEQAVLERVRHEVLDTIKVLEARVEHLEMENRRILSELDSMNVENPASEICQVFDKIPVGWNKGWYNTTDVSLVPNTNMVPASSWIQAGTLYTRYLSSDKLTMSNRHLDISYNWPTEPYQTQMYEGARGSTVFTSTEIVYFETDISYQIESDLSATNLVFEVAFATENAISKGHYVGRQSGAWSVNAHNSGTDGVVLFFKCNGGSIMFRKVLSDSTSGTEKNLKLGFYMNRVARTIAVFDIDIKKRIYTFTDVDDQQDLWPVFGVYQAGNIDARLRLNTQKDIKSLPCDLF